MLVEGSREHASKCQMSKCLGQTNSGTAFSPKAPYLPRRVDQVSPFRLDCDITSRHVHVRLPALAIPIFTISADHSATFTESCRWTRAAPTTSLSPPACKFVCYCCAQSSPSPAFLPHVLLGCHCCLAKLDQEVDGGKGFPLSPLGTTAPPHAFTTAGLSSVLHVHEEGSNGLQTQLESARAAEPMRLAADTGGRALAQPRTKEYN